MRVLVTGGAGFIGSYIADHLTERGDTVLVVDNLSTGKEQHVPAAADFVRIDIDSSYLSRLNLPCSVGRFESAHDREVWQKSARLVSELPRVAA